MKRSIGLLAIALVLVSATAFAATTTTYKVQKGDTWESIAAKVGTTTQALVDLNQPTQGSTINIPAPVVVVPPPPVDVCSNIAGVQTTVPAGDQIVNGLCVPIVVVPPTTGEIVHLNTYTTGYANHDNTPRGSTETDLGGHQGVTGGTGTYANPVTVAVGGSIINGKEVDDFAYGTIFYVADLRKYFKATDFCGDGNTPQNQPCHNLHASGNSAPTGATLWIDLFVGGGSATEDNCESAITALHTVIENPASNYAVVAGDICSANQTPQAQFGDVLVTQ